MKGGDIQTDGQNAGIGSGLVSRADQVCTESSAKKERRGAVRTGERCSLWILILQ